MTTKTAQFTPGPWNAYNSKNGVIYKHWRVNTGTGLILLDDAAHWEAGNANLIAAAPAMYEVLKRIKVLMESGDIEGRDWVEYGHIINALAQAEGR